MAKRRGLPTSFAWQLEFVRLIAFPVSPPVVVEQEWWKDLVVSQPEDYVSIRKKEYRNDRGLFQGVLLSLTVDFKRIVWEARPPAVVGPSGDYPTLDGPFRDKLGWFVALLNPWLMTTCPSLLRLGFSAKLLQPAPSAKEAYRVLATHLPIVKLEPSPNDFLLQINRRKAESDVVAGLPINRVSTWSKMNVGIVIEPGQSFQWPDRCYSALELDINTAPERAEVISRDSVPQLFQELTSLGVDIAERGDVP